MKYIKYQRRMKEEENYRTNTQLKMKSVEQVCFMCLCIFTLSIYNCYYVVYNMEKKDKRRRKLSNKYSTQNDVIGAGTFYVYVYIYVIDIYLLQ